MKQGDRTKAELISEIVTLQKRISEWEQMCHSSTQTGDAVQESLDKYRNLFENAPLSYQSLDDNGCFLEVNSTWLQTLGYTLDEVIGKSYADFLHPDFVDLFLKNFPLLMKRGHVHDVPFRLRHKQGHYIDIALEGCIGNHPDGTFKQTYCVFKDVTQQKQAEEALQKTNSLLSSIIESPANIIVFALDRDYNYLSFNSAHVREMKQIYDADIETGQFIFSYMSNKADQRKAEINYKRVLNGERFVEIQEYGRAESPTWYEMAFNPIIGEADVVTGFSLFGQDITERKQAENNRLEFEKRILQTQKLESLGILAGGIAHDFNNILMGILGYADLALGVMAPIAPAREYVQEINNSSRKAADLVKQMLAYSGKGKFSLEPIDLNKLLEDTVEMLQISISKSAVLKQNYAADPLYLEGDPSQIRQVIMNLVINASDAVGKKSGVIALTTGSMHCDREYIESTGFDSRIARKEPISEGMYVFLEVSDTGGGMPPDVIGRIFEPFFTTKFTGRGLGLSAVLGIVRGHSGMIKIYTEERKGSTFKVLFPLSSANEITQLGGQEVTPAGAEWRGQGTFLIADDEEAVRSVSKHMIRKMGFDVLTADDGRQAVEIYREHATEIVGILLDLTMPHKDGAEVFREIRQINPDIKVILSSGYNEQDATQQFVGKGLAGFIQKPFGSADLRAKIKEVVGPSLEIDKEP